VEARIAEIGALVGGAALFIYNVYHRTGGLSVNGVRESGGQGLAIAVWVVCFLISYHAVRASITVSREVQHERQTPSPVRYLEIVSPSGEHIPADVEQKVYSRPHLKLGATAVCILLAMAILAYLVFEKQKDFWEQSTEPADRANLHVIDVELRTLTVDEKTIESWEKQFLPSFPMMALQGQMATKKAFPEAFITMKNVGRNRALAPFIVRTAMIISNPLFDEAELFKPRPEWQIGGEVSIGNDWYPTDPPHIIHTRYDVMLSNISDWKGLVRGEKVFYVVTRAQYKDRDGFLPDAESCYWFSLAPPKDQRGKCWGHNN
jgi:hypothetical protein